MTNNYDVTLNITCRHIELTPGIKDHAEKRFAKVLKKFAHQDLKVHLVLDVQKNRQIAEGEVHVTGHTFTAKEEGTDLYAAIDRVADLLGTQLKKNKEKLTDHHA
jgi:putative sigma-54 modulation protein